MQPPSPPTRLPLARFQPDSTCRSSLFPSAVLAVADKLDHPCHEVLHHGGIQSIPNLLAFTTAGDKLRALQHREVVRHRGFSHVEFLSQSPGRYFAVAKQAKDFATSRVGQRPEYLIVAQRSG